MHERGKKGMEGEGEKGMEWEEEVEEEKGMEGVEGKPKEMWTHTKITIWIISMVT